MGLLDFLGFGNKSAKIAEFIANGAVIIDVRSASEYKSGHIEGSKNIPLDAISSKIEEIKKLNKPVIACCASGMRSGMATATLKSNGIEAMNGGGWSSLNSKL
jgi:phage shock protein E